MDYHGIFILVLITFWLDHFTKVGPILREKVRSNGSILSDPFLLIYSYTLVQPG